MQFVPVPGIATSKDSCWPSNDGIIERHNKTDLVEVLFKKSGGFGWAELAYSTIIGISLFLRNFVVYSIPFLLSNYAAYECVLTDDAPADFECNQEAICDESQYIVSYSETSASVYNWI